MKNLTFAIIFLTLFTVSCAGSSQKRSLGQVMDDERIAINLRTKFMKDKGIPSHKILVRVQRGVVTLEGDLNSQNQINRAIEVSERQNGVKEVKALLVLHGFGELRDQPTPAKRRQVTSEKLADAKPKTSAGSKQTAFQTRLKTGKHAKSNLHWEEGDQLEREEEL